MDLFSRTSDHFGYYTVCNQKTYSKFEAIKLHKKTGGHPEWHYHDEIFSSYDWTQEPTQSLDSLYKKRAEQLREKYDYIVLFYSGGADSTNVLDTFINNNIHLDEIATFHQYTGNKNRTTFTDGEITNVAMPRIQQLKESHPHIVHRSIDRTPIVYNYFKDLNNAESFIYSQSINMAACNVRNRIFEYEKFYKDSILNGKNICFLWGVDKPRLLHDNGRFNFRFLDILDGSVVPGTTAPVEFFYWSPDLPELIIKQAHIVKRYLENSDASSRFIFQNTGGYLAGRKVGDQTLWLSNDGVHSLIYPTWDINTFTAGKAPSSIISPGSRWFITLGETDQSLANWKSVMQHWWQEIPEYWRNDPNDVLRGVKGCFSKSYFLN